MSALTIFCLGAEEGHTLYISTQKIPNVYDLRVSTNICSDLTWIPLPLLLTYTETIQTSYSLTINIQYVLVAKW